MFDYYDYPYIYRKMFKPAKPVRHQQTCPVCERKLVNTYRRGNMWKCKQCWDMEDETRANNIPYNEDEIIKEETK